MLTNYGYFVSIVKLISKVKGRFWC